MHACRLLCGLVAALVLAPAASAASVSYAYNPGSGDHRSDPEYHGLLVYGGAEADVISVTFAGGRIDVVDASAPLEVSYGCESLDAHRASCRVTSATFLRATIWGGPGDDRVELVGALANGSAEVNGEEGDDILVGGRGDDLLLGGPGRDELHGGGGRDVLSVEPRDVGEGELVDGGAGRDQLAYARYGLGLPGPVTIDLAAGTLQTRAGAVAVRAVEDVEVWAPGAVVSGDDGPNTLETGYGADAVVLDGRGGDDRLISTTWRVQMLGGQGDDVLIFSATDLVDGGPGDDLLTGEEHVELRSPPNTTLVCGPGRDAVADIGGLVGGRDCERLSFAGVGWAAPPRLTRDGTRVVVTFSLDLAERVCGAVVHLKSPSGYAIAQPVVVRLPAGAHGRRGVALALSPMSRLRVRSGAFKSVVVDVRAAIRCPARGPWGVGARHVAGAWLR